MATKSSGHRFDRCAGHLALDFANTVTSRHASPIERLPDCTELLSFARQCELASPANLKRMETHAGRKPADAEAVRRRAVELREALYRLFFAVAGSRPVDPRDLEVLNRWVVRLRIGPDLTWQLDAEPTDLDAIFDPIVQTSVGLLTASARDRIRICEADDCLWLFLDTSKNRSRRWCDMAQCGNRMKARRFVARHRDE